MRKSTIHTLLFFYVLSASILGIAVVVSAGSFVVAYITPVNEVFLVIGFALAIGMSAAMVFLAFYIARRCALALSFPSKDSREKGGKK